MAFRASCRFALRAARSKVVGLGARPALAAATGAIAVGYAFSKPSGCQAPQLVDVSGLTKVAKTDDVPWIHLGDDEPFKMDHASNMSKILELDD